MTSTSARPIGGRLLRERVRSAWATYALTTAGLEGREYEAAEAMAWTALQRELERLGAGAPAPEPPTPV